METQRTIVLLSGGFSNGENTDQDVFLLESSMRRKPRVCFIPTASGDSRAYIERFYTAFKRYSCIPAHLELFRRTELNLEEFIRRQDIIYVGGGNTANLLAVWRLHGLDRVLRKAYVEGTVLSGISAGAACWFESCLTDSFGGLEALNDGLGILPGSFCPHFNTEPGRPRSFLQTLQSGTLPPGVALDDGAAVRYCNEVVDVVYRSVSNAGLYNQTAKGICAVEL